MKKTLTTIAALFALTSCSPVIENLLPNSPPASTTCVPTPATECPVQPLPPVTPLYVMQTCPQALQSKPDMVWLVTHCQRVVQVAALGLGLRP